ncbi:DUF1630-domain-containing protein [Jaminaea rosea]|uniref:DUF1630-domain-containing protein n=1 Tax=Jaminaea rosea TaxID=1569628 RepID=A0A316UWA3_9BASI|nr:DUF1630-domain-containing protein [Jaminaea rosea]PWN29580.1 DUF1630-domain-containing protein [Jaminaea rosea]
MPLASILPDSASAATSKDQGPSPPSSSQQKLSSSSSHSSSGSQGRGGANGDLSLSQLHLSSSPPNSDSQLSSHINDHQQPHGRRAASGSSSSATSASSRPAPFTANSRDSLNTAAYFSAEEDIADERVLESVDHSTTSETPATSTSHSQEGASSPPSAAAAAKKKKRRKSGKSRQKDIPPPPTVSPRRTSLGKASLLHQASRSAANEEASSFKAAAAGGDLSEHSSTFGSAGLAIGAPLAAAAGASSVQTLPRKTSVSSSGRRTPTGLGLPMSNHNDVAPTLSQEVVEKRLLQRWILSIGVVNFDLEKGPDLETLSPPLDISREERDNIAFSSFPDTSIFDVGDTTFSFRAREVPLDASVSSPPHFATLHPPRLASAVNDCRGREASEPGGLLSSQGGAASNSSSASSIIPPHDQQQTASKSIQRSASVSDFGSTSASTVAPATPQASSARGVAAPASSTKISNSSSSSYIYGYVFFRQKRDPAIRRGYFQKSLVILSHLPYVALFTDIVTKLGPLYFEHGDPILEAFSGAVTKWPNPAPGATLPLPLFGAQLWVALPLGRQGQSAASDASQPGLSSSASSASLRERAATPTLPRSATTTAASSSGGSNSSNAGGEPGSSEESPILASIPSTPLISVFKEALADLWLIWECVLLAEPILVIGPSPQICSEAVWHLLDICRPIPHAGDFRPFFTIHDYDFKNLATRKQPPAGTIIGCTNPFLAQACAHWPHVLRVGKAAVKLGTAGKYGKAGDVKPPMGGGVAGGTGAGGGGPQHLPGFETKKKRRVSKDRPMLKRVLELVDKEDNPQLANTVLRRYLADITERFLAPLNRYVSSLIPATQRPVDRSQIKPFNTDDFLASLKAHGTPLLLRSRSLPTGAGVRQGLYLDFLRSPNFSYYLTERITYFCTLNPVPSSRKTRFEEGGRG